ncbi:MAG: L,D-transpeptidase family protein [Pseudomonadota bacterium]
MCSRSFMTLAGLFVLSGSIPSALADPAAKPDSTVTVATNSEARVDESRVDTENLDQPIDIRRRAQHNGPIEREADPETAALPKTPKPSSNTQPQPVSNDSSEVASTQPLVDEPKPETALEKPEPPPTETPAAADATAAPVTKAPVVTKAPIEKPPVLADVASRLSVLDRAKSDYDKSAREAIIAFYGARENEPVWVSAKGLTPRAIAVRAEMAEAGSWGLEPAAFKLPEADASSDAPTPEALADLEVRMALAVLTYAHHARGGRVDPEDLSFDIDFRRTIKDPANVLAEIANALDPVAYLRRLHPKAEQFHLLRAAYLKLTAPESESAGPRIDEVAYKRVSRVAMDAGLPPPPRPNFSKRKLTQPSRDKQAARLLRNMEMWRWMPEDLGETYIFANIPEYQVRIFEAGKVTFRERIIVGKFKNQTPLFSDQMELVVFNPLWHVPNSIKVKELLPGLIRGGDPVTRQGLKMRLGKRILNPRSVNWSKVDIRNVHVFQPAGERNALGRMKFLFPNKHAVYMHDTPSRHLFNKRRRAYSHGCVRTRNPLEFAVNLLRIGKGWSRNKAVATYKSSADNNEIRLNKKIPVHIGYFTAWADPETGRVRYFEDIYKHEKHIRYALTGKKHLIVKRKPNTNANLQRIRAELIERNQSSQPAWFPGGFASPWNGGPSQDNYSNQRRSWSRNPFDND